MRAVRAFFGGYKWYFFIPITPHLMFDVLFDTLPLLSKGETMKRGRKKMAKEVKQVGVHLDTKTHETITEIAIQEDRTVSAQIRVAIKYYLSNHNNITNEYLN